MSKPAKIGPWGGPGGDEQNVQVMPGRLASVTIHSGDTIDAISFTYIGTDYVPYSAGPWGRTLNTESTITLDPTDYVTGISGTFGTAFDNDRVVTSLKISTFKEKDGSKTYGKPNGTPFHIPVRDGGRVVGFFGRSGDMLDAIGVYFAP
ncbi:horcolin isoform X1 [Brachypodium distachyon]|uniref:Jacalin-type lectin domain-containing protein n=1 Tax=Brachypodium distachyon TaxID=15368 RepID=A0A0Q3F985_BRADI|nr:horcolin isoform X1 [Brachypodium distachyon]KQJ95910.1 hypothetical protein BRADI_3g19730v3 [Brachypodium distachyon]|eukprot:XP_024318295.1 horcolin isoform X1 [Brachypodium distachyon]